MKVPDRKLRADRMVFYARDIDLLDGELDGFLEYSGAKAALLIDREGHLVTRRGEPVAGSMDSLSALIAGSFAATKEMARLLGEEEFSSLVHQGDRQSVQLLLIGQRTILAIVWDERTNLGLVRFYAQETAKRLEQAFFEIGTRPIDETQNEGLGDDYSKEATAALDDLF